MNKPFNLEAFKQGQQALTRDGRTATFLAICADCSVDFRLILLLEGNHKPTTCGLDGRRTQSTTEIDDADLVSMVSRHQALIDAYNPEDTWQVHTKQSGVWITIKEPDFDDTYEWRLRPHNDLIKAHEKGAKIETKNFYGNWVLVHDPDWCENKEYRIKPEPVIYCLAYDAKRFNHEQTRAVRARVVKKEIAEANGWKIIQEWEMEV